MLGHIQIVSRPSLQVVYVLFPSHLNHQISLLPINLIEDFAKWEPHLISIVMMKLVHIESKVREHLIVELVEILILFRVLTVDFSENVAEDHEHPSFVEHAFDFFVDLQACEEVEGLSYSDKIIFFFVVEGCNAILFQNNLAVWSSFFELINLTLSYSEHLCADVNAFGVWEGLTETQQYFPCANCDIKVLLSLLKGLQGILPKFLRVLRPVFFIINALGFELPDVHVYFELKDY